MIENEKYEGKFYPLIEWMVYLLIDCTLAYILLSRIPNGIDEMLLIFQNHVSKLGKITIQKLGPATKVRLLTV